MPYITEVPVKKSILIVLLSALLALPSCAPAREEGEIGRASCRERV